MRHRIEAFEDSALLVFFRRCELLYQRSEELDLCQVTRLQRHPLVFERFDALTLGESFGLTTDHNHVLLNRELETTRAGQTSWEHLNRGPDRYRIRIRRVAPRRTSDGPVATRPEDLLYEIRLGRRTPRWRPSMATTLPGPSTLPRESYLNSEHGLKSWLLTQDHKRIAILYLFSTVFFFVIGGVAASLIRLELLTPAGDLVSSDTYNKLFSIHGIIMVFFFLVPIAPAVLGNFLIPLMIGARDVAFPRLNLASWYLFVIGGGVELYMMISGGVDTGWTFTTPLSTHYVNTHVIAAAMGIFIAGFSSILTGLNFIVTIHRLRAPGMTWFRLPLFVWSYYATSIIFVLATPVVAMTMVLVALERIVGIGVFDPTKGGEPFFSSICFGFILILPCMS